MKTEPYLYQYDIPHKLREFHVSDNGLRWQRHVKRRGQELHVHDGVGERRGDARVVVDRTDGAAGTRRGANHTRRGAEQVHDQLDVVDLLYRPFQDTFTFALERIGIDYIFWNRLRRLTSSSTRPYSR